MIVSTTASPRSNVAPVVAGQHVATVMYRGESGTDDFAQAVVAQDAPGGIGFSFTGYPKLEDAVAEARQASEGPDGAAGVFAMGSKRFGFAPLEYARPNGGSGSDAPQGITAGEAAHLGLQNLGWGPDITAVGAKRATESLLMIVDGEQTIDVRGQEPIAPIDTDGHGDGLL